MELSELFVNARNGEKNSEKVLFSFLFVRFTLLVKRTFTTPEAEDIAQDACVTILEKYEELADDCNYSAWAYKILRNKIGNHIQKRNTYNKHLTNHNKVEYLSDASTSDPTLKYHIEVCLRKLLTANRRYFDILMMSVDGYDTDDICDKYDIKPGYLYVILNRCRTQLINCLSTKEGSLHE